MAVLQLLGADKPCPSLYDPRLIDLSGTTLRFIGYERVESAWVCRSGSAI